MNKKKIFNDPLYGFVHIHSPLIFDIIQHPFFQRLRRIRQLGVSEYVYPGGLHTRFQHAIGAMHLMSKALDNLRTKGIEIDDNEYEASMISVLLHDIGHGPFSHALEYSLLQGIDHESLSYLLMKRLNKEFNNELELAIKIFQGTYHKKFLHQLVSSQLDVDRMDYLKRDSFFTGVSEGTIGVERILEMLNVVDDNIVVEEKGIYSIENFLNARRLMYWQVYLHKTSLGAERMLINLINRAKTLAHTEHKVFASPSLSTFLEKNMSLEDFQTDNGLLEVYGNLDDHDIWGAIKVWQKDSDKVLSMLSTMLLERTLFKIILVNEPTEKDHINAIRDSISKQYGLLRSESRHFMTHGEVTNKAYMSGGQTINILTKKGDVIDIAKAADLPNIKAISKIVKKYYVGYPKNVSL